MLIYEFEIVFVSFSCKCPKINASLRIDTLGVFVFLHDGRREDTHF